jgi:hypothetical protein
MPIRNRAVSDDRFWPKADIRNARSADQCPRITKEFLAEELAELGAQRFSEEYGLEFLDPTEGVFPTEIIEAAFTPEVMPLW